MRRGELWTVAGGSGYAGKPRPSVIIQDDNFEGTRSVKICALTTDPTEAPLFRIVVEPSELNGLAAESRLMVDKITTVPRAKLGQRLGRLSDADLLRLNQAMLVFLGLAGSSRARR